jgi:hypothetical protein
VQAYPDTIKIIPYYERNPTGRGSMADPQRALLVDQNWDAIEVIGGALLEKETLSYDDVIRILKERCPDFHTGEKS